MRTSYQLGANLGTVLERHIARIESEGTPREQILAEMAGAAGLLVSQVQAIATGADEDVTLDTLVAFAGVLNCSLGELIKAAEMDGNFVSPE